MERGAAAVFLGRLDDVAALSEALCLSPDLSRDRNPAALAMAAYRRWGSDEFAGRLFGDYGIVLWDGSTGRLVLTRSPSGLYPLFHRRRGDELHFATSPRPLLDGDSAAPDEQAMAEWLIMQPRLSDRTFFAGISRVAPGTSVIFERGGLRVARHWRPEMLGTLHLRDHRDFAEMLRKTLRTAVADRVRGVGDVAAQLSGGLDSSSVVALAAEELAPSGRRVHAFTAVPGVIGRDPVGGRFLDEGNHAAAVAAMHDNIVHARLAPKKTPLLETLDRHADADAVPPFNPHHLQWMDRTYAAAGAVGATTLLTGAMGNATISGSGAFALAGMLRRGRLGEAVGLFGASRRAGALGLRHVPSVALTAFAPRFLDVLDRVRLRHVNMWEYTGLRPAFARAHGIDLARWNRRVAPGSFRTHAEQFLDRFDLGMMQETPRRLYGVDATDPTYDRRVIELTLQIPLEQFTHDGVPRALIRTAMAGRLPDVVRLERRRGLQSADFLTMLASERRAIGAEIMRFEDIDQVRRAIDVPVLRERLDWSAGQVAAYGWYQYSNRLMRSLSIGRFVRRMLDGSLFATATASRFSWPDRAAIWL